MIFQHYKSCPELNSEQDDIHTFPIIKMGVARDKNDHRS